MKTATYGIACYLLATVLTLYACQEDTPSSYNHEEAITPDTVFKPNYEIDLKQDCYIVYDGYAQEYHVVAIGELEEFFLQDNL